MQELYLLIAVVFGLLALVLASVSYYRSQETQKQFRKLLSGLDTKGNLTETLQHYFTSVKNVENQLDKIQKNYQYLSTIATSSIQKIAIVRFNPFKNTGGDQSFVLAMLDNHNNGLLLTSIHSREGTRVYIKEVRYGNSKYTLSKEEQSALKNAQDNKEKE